MIDPVELRRVLGHFEPPQVLVCLDRANRSYAAFAGAATFAVNVLAVGQEPLARLFAGQEERKFGAVPFRPGEATGARCVIGDVRAASTGGGEPQLFYRGRYARIADSAV